MCRKKPYVGGIDNAEENVCCVVSPSSFSYVTESRQYLAARVSEAPPNIAPTYEKMMHRYLGSKSRLEVVRAV